MSFNIKNIRALPFITLFFLIASASVARAEIRYFWKPTLSAPQFVRPGGPLYIDITFPDKSTVTSMTLLSSTNLSRQYDITPKTTVAGLSASFKVSLPADIETGLYDICMKFDSPAGAVNNCEAHSVNVIAEFKKTFRFAVISDYHVGDNRATELGSGMPMQNLRKKGLQSVAAQKPDFAIYGGDIVSYPSTFPVDYKKSRREIKENSPYPVFLVPGNHDLFASTRKGLKNIDGIDFWKEVYGPMHTAFSYGHYRFIGFNGYNWPYEKRDLTDGGNGISFSHEGGGMLSPEEFAWLEKEVTDAKSKGFEPVLFNHFEPDSFATRKELGDLKAVSREDFKKALRQWGVRHIFYGHSHDTDITVQDGITLIRPGTFGADPSEGQGWRYIIIDVTPDGVFKPTVVEYQTPNKPTPEKEKGDILLK